MGYTKEQKRDMLLEELERVKWKGIFGGYYNHDQTGVVLYTDKLHTKDGTNVKVFIEMYDDDPTEIIIWFGDLIDISKKEVILDYMNDLNKRQKPKIGRYHIGCINNLLVTESYISERYFEANVIFNILQSLRSDLDDHFKEIMNILNQDDKEIVNILDKENINSASERVKQIIKELDNQGLVSSKKRDIERFRKMCKDQVVLEIYSGIPFMAESETVKKVISKYSQLPFDQVKNAIIKSAAIEVFYELTFKSERYEEALYMTTKYDQFSSSSRVWLGNMNSKELLQESIYNKVDEFKSLSGLDEKEVREILSNIERIFNKYANDFRCFYNK